LAAHQIKHTLHEARKSQLPVIPFFTDKQKGETFAERITGAIAQGFALGYEKVIICGTDTLQLSSNHFTAVAKKLQTHQLVIGPSADGGIYLLALRKAAFCPASLHGLPWLTSHLFTNLCTYSSTNNFSFVIEEQTIDIDDVSSLYYWQSIHKHHWYTAIVSQLMACFGKLTYNAPFVVPYRQASMLTPAFRGPPPGYR
jgi:glycosyltransferase A (GT-A) superfamily protein (DUF2064 family)